MNDSLEIQDTSVETQNVSIVDYGAFANYIRKAATILLPEEDAVPPALNIALEDKANQDCIKKFLSDSQVQALYIQRSCSKGKLIKNLCIIWAWDEIFFFSFVLFCAMICTRKKNDFIILVHQHIDSSNI